MKNMKKAIIFVLMLFVLPAVVFGAMLGAGDGLIVGSGGTVQEQCDNQPVITDEFREECDASGGMVVFNENYKGCMLSFACLQEGQTIEEVSTQNTGIAGVDLIKRPKGGNIADNPDSANAEVTTTTVKLPNGNEPVVMEASNSDGSGDQGKAIAELVMSETQAAEKVDLTDETIESVEYKGAAAYAVSGTKEKKFLGLFRVQMKVTAYVNAENGEVMKEKRPWWSFLAFGGN